MARPKKKDNPKRITAYISGDVYDMLQKKKEEGVPISDVIEQALRNYLSTNTTSNDFAYLLRSNIEEGMTWEEFMHKINIHAPRDMVSLMNDNTIPTGNRRVYKIKGVEDWLLVDPGNAPSNIRFVFQKAKNISKNNKS